MFLRYESKESGLCVLGYKRPDCLDEIHDKLVADPRLHLLCVVERDLELRKAHHDGLVALVCLQELAQRRVDDCVQRRCCLCSVMR